MPQRILKHTHFHSMFNHKFLGENIAFGFCEKSVDIGQKRVPESFCDERGRNTCQLRASITTDDVPVHNVQFVKYDVTVSFMAQVLDTVTYLVPQVLDTAS